jgi:hypothetical protein
VVDQEHVDLIEVVDPELEVQRVMLGLAAAGVSAWFAREERALARRPRRWSA